MSRRRSIVGVVFVVVALCGWTPLANAQASSDTVYVTKTGSKYHRAGCASLSRSAIPMTLADAAKRYGPCSRCKPPVPAAPAAGSVVSTTPPRSAARPTTAPKNDGRCQAITKKGTRCSRRAKPGSLYCWQHGG